MFKLVAQINKLQKELDMYKAECARLRLEEAETEVEFTMIECSDCGDPMPRERDDYLCEHCRSLLDKQHETTVKAQTEHDIWEDMRQDAMATGYRQAVIGVHHT